MRRLLTLFALTLTALLFTGCSQQIGTVGYVGSQRVSEAEVDRAATAFARYGYDRDTVTLFVVEGRAASAILAAKQLDPDYDTRAQAAADSRVAALLDDPDTHDVTMGVLDFAGLSVQLEPHGLAVAIADTVRLDPRYGQLAAVPDSSGQLSYTLTGLSQAGVGSLSEPGPR